MTWKPIETAPKDGTFIMIYRGPSYEAFGCQLVWWDDQFMRWDDGNSIPNDYASATHWMPLPDPPKKATKRKT